MEGFNALDDFTYFPSSSVWRVRFQLPQAVKPNPNANYLPFISLFTLVYSFVIWINFLFILIVPNNGVRYEECDQTNHVWIFVLVATCAPLILGPVALLLKLLYGNLNAPFGEDFRFMINLVHPIGHATIGGIGVALWMRMEAECTFFYMAAAPYLLSFFYLIIVFYLTAAVIGFFAIIMVFSGIDLSSPMFTRIIGYLVDLSPFNFFKHRELLARKGESVEYVTSPGELVLTLLYGVFWFWGLFVVVWDAEAREGTCADEAQIWWWVLIALLATPIVGAFVVVLRAWQQWWSDQMDADARARRDLFAALPDLITSVVLAYFGVHMYFQSIDMSPACAIWYSHHTNGLVIFFYAQVIFLLIAGICSSLAVIIAFIERSTAAYNEILDAENPGRRDF